MTDRFVLLNNLRETKGQEPADDKVLHMNEYDKELPLTTYKVWVVYLKITNIIIKNKI